MILNYPPIQLGLSEFKTRRLWRTAFAEFVTLILFVYIGCGTVVAVANFPDADGSRAAKLTAIALAHGLAIAVLAASTSAISGGHVNPAVTVAMVATGKVTVVRGIFYIIFQLMGAVLGAAFLRGSIPTELRGNLGSHTLNPAITPGQGVGIEIVLTFALVFVIFASAVDKKGHGTIAPILIGFTVVIDHFVGVFFTGASMNPARSFGPALISGTWDHHYVYWFGPILGAVFAGVLYQIAFLTPTQKHGAQGGGIDEVTPAVLLQEIRNLKGAFGGNSITPGHGDGQDMSAPLGVIGYVRTDNEDPDDMA